MKNIAGLILAGGQSRRMGGIDKSFVDLGAKPLIRHVIDGASPQVAALAINTNSDDPRYSDFGFPIIPDGIKGFQGPLAGIQAGLAWLSDTNCEWLATFACDTPFVPSDCVTRLGAAAAQQKRPAAVAAYGDRRHPTIGLWHRELLHVLDTWLDGEGRMLMAFCDEVGAAVADYSDQPFDPFVNINREADVDDARRRLENGA